MNEKMNIRDWLTPRRTVVLVLVLVGAAFQLFAIIDSDSAYLDKVGIVLLISGLVVELIGQAIGDQNDGTKR